MERVIVFFVFLILTAICGGMLGRFFHRPDISNLIGNSVMGVIGVIIIFILICYGIAILKLRRIQKQELKDESAGSSLDSRCGVIEKKQANSDDLR